MMKKKLTRDEVLEALSQENVEFGPTDQVDVLGHWVQVVLDAIGYPEALVSDESYLSDFRPFDPSEVNQWLADIQEALGMEVTLHDTSIIELAQRVRDARSH